MFDRKLQNVFEAGRKYFGWFYKKETTTKWEQTLVIANGLNIEKAKQ